MLEDQDKQKILILDMVCTNEGNKTKNELTKYKSTNNYLTNYKKDLPDLQWKLLQWRLGVYEIKTTQRRY